MAEAAKKDDAKGKSRRHRSPAYPAISLRKALERARQFYAVQKQHAAPIEAAVGIWEFAPKSSGGLQAVSALKQYGLMNDGDETGARRIQLSERALRIIRDEREPSSERDEAIKKAALLPKIYAEMWAKWGPAFPVEATMKFFLVQDKKFNEASVADLIATYKDTVEFAKLVESDKVHPSADGEPGEQSDQIKSPPPPPPLGAKAMEGERIVFTHEVEPQHGVRIVASGAIDVDVIDAVESFLTLQRKRLKLVKTPSDGNAK